MKKSFFKLIFVFLMLIFNNNVLALSLEENEVYIEASKQESIKLYADLPEGTVKVEFTLVFDSYDIPVYFSPTTGITDKNPNGIKHTLLLSEASNGEIFLGTVVARVVKNPKVTSSGADIHSASAILENGEKQQLKIQKLTINVGKKIENTNNQTGNTNNTDINTQKQYNLLKEIKNGEEVIAIKDNVFNYNVMVFESVKELDLEVVPKNSKYKIEIGNQKISELKDNKIIITVTNGNQKQEYVVNVKIKKEPVKVEIDNTEFESKTSHKIFWVFIIIVSSISIFGGLVLSRKIK